MCMNYHDCPQSLYLQCMLSGVSYVEYCVLCMVTEHSTLPQVHVCVAPSGTKIYLPIDSTLEPHVLINC